MKFFHSTWFLLKIQCPKWEKPFQGWPVKFKKGGGKLVLKPTISPVSQVLQRFMCSLPAPHNFEGAALWYVDSKLFLVLPWKRRRFFICMSHFWSCLTFKKKWSEPAFDAQRFGCVLVESCFSVSQTWSSMTSFVLKRSPNSFVHKIEHSQVQQITVVTPFRPLTSSF